MDIFLNFIFTTIYGAIAVVAIVAIPLVFLTRIFPIITETFIGAIMFIVFVFSLFTLGSVPLYLFDKNVEKHIREVPEWVDVTSKETTSDIFLPLTLFYPPITGVFLTGPSDEGVLTKNQFVQYILEPNGLKIKKTGRLITVLCASNEIELPPKWSEAGEVFYAYSRTVPISQKNFQIYCERDWSQERELLRQQILSDYKDLRGSL